MTKQKQRSVKSETEDLSPVSVDDTEGDSDFLPVVADQITPWQPNTQQALVLADPANDLNAYLRLIRALPQLTAEEEQTLARRYQTYQDLRAAEQLVLANLRHVIPIVRSYKGYGLAEADLIQEGSIGLMKAVKRFDPEAGVRLMTFATHWIRAEINEYIIKNWRTVKIATTKPQRKLFFKLRSHKKSLEALTPSQAAVIAEELGVKPEEVMEMDMRLNSPEVPVAIPNSDDDEEAPVLTLVDQQNIPEQRVLAEESEQRQIALVQHALSQLTPREKYIIEARLLSEEKATLADLAAEFDVSLERIRQIETAALKKLKNTLAELAH
jgi:RNA polymerase sigma-32 factor